MSKKVFVGNLKYDVADSDLFDHFAQYGEVRSARVVVDRESGQSRGFGFVEFATEEEAEGAIQEVNGTDFRGRQISCSAAHPQNERRAGGGGNGGGNGGGEFRFQRGGGGGGEGRRNDRRSFGDGGGRREKWNRS